MEKQNADLIFDKHVRLIGHIKNDVTFQIEQKNKKTKIANYNSASKTNARHPSVANELKTETKIPIKPIDRSKPETSVGLTTKIKPRYFFRTYF